MHGEHKGTTAFPPIATLVAIGFAAVSAGRVVQLPQPDAANRRLQLRGLIMKDIKTAFDICRVSITCHGYG